MSVKDLIVFFPWKLKSEYTVEKRWFVGNTCTYLVPANSSIIAKNNALLCYIYRKDFFTGTNFLFFQIWCMCWHHSSYISLLLLGYLDLGQANSCNEEVFKLFLIFNEHSIALDNVNIKSDIPSGKDLPASKIRSQNLGFILLKDVTGTYYLYSTFSYL